MSEKKSEPTSDKIVLYDPKGWPFGPLSAHNIDDLFLDDKKWPTVINYVLTNTLTTPIYKLGLQFASIQPKGIVGAKKEERIAQIIQTVAGHEKRDLTEAEKQEIRDMVNWEEEMSSMNIYEKWHHFLYKERVDTTYKALETAFRAKYDQDPLFAQSLHATDNRPIEYVSPNTILGTGPQEEDAEQKPSWNGLNLLGVCLTQLRHRENLAKAFQAKQILEARQREDILNVWRAENILLNEIQNKTKAMDNIVLLSAMPFREAKLYYDSTGIERFLGKSATEIVNTFPNIPDQPLLHDSIIRMYKRRKGPLAELYRSELNSPGSLAQHYYEKQQQENREKSHLQKMKDIIVMYTESIIEQMHPEFSPAEVTKAAGQLEWTAPSVEAYNILRAKIIKLYKERALPVEILERISMFIGDEDTKSGTKSEEQDENEDENEDRESTSSSASSSASSDSDDPLKQLLGSEKDRKTHYANRLAQYTGRAPRKYRKWSEEKLKSALKHYGGLYEKDANADQEQFSDDELPEAQGEWILFAKTGRGGEKIEIGRRAEKPTMSEIEDIVKKYNKRMKKQRPKITEDQVFFITDFPQKGTTTIEIRHADGTTEKFGEYSRTGETHPIGISTTGLSVGDFVNIQRPGGPYKIKAVSGSALTVINKAGLEIVISPSEILSKKPREELLQLKGILPERADIVSDYNVKQIIRPSQVIVSWSESIGHMPFEHEDQIDIDEPEIVPIHGMPIKVYTSVTENEFGIFSPVYEKDFKVDGLVYPTVAHYITTCLIAATGMKIDAKSKPAYTRGTTIKEAYNLINSSILGTTMKPINDATQIWETRYSETFRDLLKEFSRIALTKKFTHSGMQNLLLLTGDKEIVWGDKHDAFLGVGEEKSGSNTIGKLMIEIRENLKQHIDTKSSLALSKGGVPYMHVMSFFLQDPFMRNWVRRRVKEMVSMVNKLHALTPEEELTPQFIDTVLREMYAPCNTVNSLKQVEFSTLPMREIPKKRKKDPVKVVPYMPREFVIIVDECNGLPAVEDTIFKTIEQKKEALALEENELDLELRQNLVKSMNSLEKEINLSREEVLKKIEEMEKTEAFQKKNAAEQNKERAKVWRSMSRDVNTKLDKQAGKITHAVVDRQSIPAYQKRIKPLVEELLELYKERKGILKHRDRQYEEISIAYWERATASLFAIISLLENSDENDIRKLILGAEVLASEPSVCTNIGVELPDPMENCIASALVNILVSINRFTEKYSLAGSKVEQALDFDLAVSILLGKSVKKMPELNFIGDDQQPKKKGGKGKKKKESEEEEREEKESIATSIATSVATEEEIKDADFDIEEALENREVEKEAGNAYLEQRELEAEQAMEELEQDDPKNLYNQDYDNEFSTSKSENENDMEEAAAFGFRRTGRFGVRRGAPTVDLVPYLILIRQVLGEDDEYEIENAKALASAVKAVKGFKFMDEAIKRTRINFFATLR